METNSKRLLAVSLTSVLLIAAIAPAFVLGAFHGVAVAKSTVSPVKIGDAYTSSAFIGNSLDTGHDLIRVTGLADVVNAASGASVTGNILGSTPLVFNNTALVSCTGGSGAGTSADPYIGANGCNMQFGGSITTKPFSHYTVQAGDWFLPNHRLTDTVTWSWNNTCISNPDNDCTTNPQFATAGASALIQQLTSTTRTDIHNAAHQIVTTVPVGTTVHDFVEVIGQPGKPPPTGLVVVRWYRGFAGIPCNELLDVSNTIPLTANGTVDATSFPQTPATTGFWGFRGHYVGDGMYEGSVGECEPLRVVDARISITPNGTNEVGTPHTFTVTVQKDDATGSFAAASGVSVTVTTNFGTLTGSPCTTNASGQCTVVLNSSNPGLATVQASATVPVSGVNINVATNGYGAFTVQNQKLFADAKISITPNGTNEVGNSHTFTVTLMKDTGAGFVIATGETVTTALTNSLGATATMTGGTCGNTSGTTGSGTTNASGQCTIVITSPTTGQTVANASSTLTFNGPGGTSTQISRTTDGTHGSSGPATKRWVDANILVTPQTATNPTNTNHTFTITVNKDVGDGTGMHPAAGETVTYTGTGVGTEVSNTCNLPTDANGQCRVVWTSNVAGQTKLFAYTTLTITVGGFSDTLTRDADSTTASVGHGPGGTDEALKNWETIELPCPAGIFLAGAGAAGTGDLQIAYDQFPAPNDNSYGANAAGWGGPGKHTFGNLTGSDKAGFQLLRPDGTIALSFNIDYISAKTGTPSGYASLGPFGGDGGIVVNNATNPLTNDPDKITWDTSMARNLNNTGYFAGGVENAAHKPPVTNGANLLVDSPPVVGVNPGDSPTIVNNTPGDGGQYDFKDPNPWTALYSNPEYAAMNLTGVENRVVQNVLGWNFHDTYFVTLKRPYLTSIGFPTDNSWTFAQFGQCPANTWCVQPNITVLHNSPAKPCPTGSGGGVTASDISVTGYSLKDKTVKITIENSDTTSATTITDILNLNWPAANGNLLQVKLDGDTVWAGNLPKLAGGYASLAALAGWNADAADRTITKNSSDTLSFIFQNNAAAPTNAGYSGSVRFDNSFNVQVLPQP